jgi:hypothetical protein
MDAALDIALALFRESPFYWAGVVLWLLGFAAYLPAVCGGGPPALARSALLLCWLGFAITAFASLVLDARYSAPPLERPSLEWAYWFRSSTQIWLLWLIGGALVVASGLRWFTARVGWLGVATAMVGVVASWFADSASQQVVIETGTALVAVLLAVLAWRNDLLPRDGEPGARRRVAAGR